MCILVVMYMDVLCIGLRVRVTNGGNDGGRALLWDNRSGCRLWGCWIPETAASGALALQTGNDPEARWEPRPPGERMGGMNRCVRPFRRLRKPAEGYGRLKKYFAWASEGDKPAGIAGKSRNRSLKNDRGSAATCFLDGHPAVGQTARSGDLRRTTDAGSVEASEV